MPAYAACIGYVFVGILHACTRLCAVWREAYTCVLVFASILHLCCFSCIDYAFLGVLHACTKHATSLLFLLTCMPHSCCLVLCLLCRSVWMFCAVHRLGHVAFLFGTLYACIGYAHLGILYACPTFAKSWGVHAVLLCVSFVFAYILHVYQANGTA